MESDAVGIVFKALVIFIFLIFLRAEFLVVSTRNCCMLGINTGRQIAVIIYLEKKKECTNTEVTPSKLSVCMTNAPGYLLPLSNLNTANSI
jgi:hypothetical protein